MAESYSVKAILSATDRGFTSTLKNALSSVTGLAKSVGSGMLMGAGMAAFNALTNGARNMVGEINDSNVAWKTFESNMGIIGKGSGEIAEVKKELQDFAQETVYGASDMASTYAQLAAVGTKNTTKLVKGFGGLAAAAENPQQAMKTLSQQATQMAAKPSVQWADFKLMLEQTPAGMAAVAKAMGMTTSELVTAVQDGKVKTEDFFNTIATVGGDANGEFYKMATEAKSVGQAMDGLKETVGNKLTPAFDVLSSIGIKAIEGISTKLGKLDGEAIAEKVSGWIKKAQPMWNSFQKAVSKVWAVISGVGKKLAPIFESLRSKASSAVQGLLDKIGSIDANAIVDKLCGWAQKAQPYFDLFSSAIQTVSNAISAAIPYVVDFASAIGGFLLDHAETICNVISKATPIVLGLVGAFKGYKIISSLVPGMSSFAKSIASMASGGIKGLASKLFGVAAGQTASGKAASASSKQMLASAKAFMMIGAGVLMVAAGFALLAQSAIALSNAGGLAIGVMAGLVIAVAGLTIGMMAMMKTITASPAKLTAMATAMLALGAAVLMIGVGFALMAQSSIALANAGGLAIGVMVGMVAVVALLAVGAAALGTALTAGAVGFVAFGAAIMLVGAGALLAGVALQLVAAVLPTIAAYGLQGALAITALGGAMIVFAAGAALAGAAAIVLGAGLAVAAVGVAAVGVAVAVLGAGVLVLAAGVLVAAAGLALFAAMLPLIAAHGQQGATALVALSGGVLAFAGSAAVAGAALLVLSASMVAFAASSVASAAGVAVFGAAVVVASAGTLILMAALAGVKSSMKSIASSAKTAEKSLKSMNKSVDAVQSGLDGLGSKAKSAMKKLTNAFDDTTSKAKKAGKEVGNGFTQGMQTGLAKAPTVARTTTAMVTSTLMSGRASAYSAGAYISQGFASGMLSCLGTIQAAAAKMAAADKAVRAKAKIHSPSKVAEGLGSYWGEGFVNGISDMVKDAWKAAESLVSIPNVATPNLALAYGGEMSAEYDYNRSADYSFEIPVTVDGKVIAKATAKYTQEELGRNLTRESRKNGVR
jgi:tape measure domain-containing protein